jgi:hypothetical protein
MNTRPQTRQPISGKGGSPIYLPVAIRGALAALAVVALLYCWPFTRILPSALAEVVSFVGILVLFGLGWAGIIGSFDSLISREAHPLRAILRLVFYVTGPWLYLRFTRASQFGATENRLHCVRAAWRPLAEFLTQRVQSGLRFGGEFGLLDRCVAQISSRF